MLLLPQPVGVFIITDTPTGTTRAHLTSCRKITTSTFEEKVIENNGRNGCYLLIGFGHTPYPAD